MQREKGAYRHDSVESVILILELLAEESAGLTAANISEVLGMRRNKVYRILSALELRGLVERNGRGVYLLGPFAVGLARRLLSCVSIVGHARPILEELARKHGEAVYLTVLRDDDVIFLDMAAGGRHEKASAFVGKRFPSLATAAGKVIRALHSRDLLEKTFGGRKKRERPFDLESVLAELDAIRSRGVAVDEGALDDGICSVATAVRDYAGKVVCALTVLGPSFRMLAGRIEDEIVPSLVEGAELLSMKFGYAKAA